VAVVYCRSGLLCGFAGLVPNIIDGRQFNDKQDSYCSGQPFHGVNYCRRVGPTNEGKSGVCFKRRVCFAIRRLHLYKYRWRVLAGLTSEETNEFEILDAQLPFDGKPVWTLLPSPLPPKEQRWLELHEKMETARENGLASGYWRCLTKVGEER